MARIRTIKPEFFTSEDIVSRSPMARLLYIALWCEADKEGRLVWKPTTFKLRYLPGDSCDVHELCNELVQSGLVQLYGDGYALIPSFKAHQHINPRESESQLPAPVASTTREPRVGTRQSRDDDAQGGREGKGRITCSKPPGLNIAEFPPGFDRFWTAYPRKQGKGIAAKAFARIRPDEALLETILAAVSAQASTEQWRKDGGQFVPMPATWLNGQRWLDETTAVGATDPVLAEMFRRGAS